MKSYVKHQIEHTFSAEFSSYVCDSGCSELHFHKNYEVIVVIRGECFCEVGGQEYTLTGGDAVFILPFQTHKFTVKNGGAVRCTTFHEHINLTLSRTIDGNIPTPPVFRPSKNALDFHLTQMDKLFGSDSGMLKRITPPAKRIQVKGTLYILEGEFLEQTTLVHTQGEEAITMTVVKHVSENFRSDISLADVAKATGYNYQYLSRTFNQILGINFKSLLNQFRMEYAFCMLQDTELPISEIAFDSGFQSIRTFNHVCKEIFGKSPKELRTENRQL